MPLPLSRILNDLNESQRKAVVKTEGPLLIVAGPGTGKTLTIVRRIAYLISKGIQPENILAVTFTNRAAREMKERSEALLGQKAHKVFIGTFHQLGLFIIQGEHSGPYVIYSRPDQIHLLKKLTQGIARVKGCSSSMMIAERISRIKNFMEPVDNEIEDLYEKYQTALTKERAFDFDDLIIKPLEIFRQKKEVLEHYRHIFRYVMVDEYQDINPAQHKLLTCISHFRGNICVIGDSDQAIYAFRGADVGNFLNFKEDFQDTQMVTLTKNYRSTNVVLEASTVLIRNNQKRIDKELTPNREDGLPITVISVPDEKTEGEIIVKEIEAKMGGTSHYQIYAQDSLIHEQQLHSFSDFAVMYRTNGQAKIIEESLKVSGMPYQVIGEQYSRNREELINILTFLKALIEPEEDIHTISTSLQEEYKQISLEKSQIIKDLQSIHEFIHFIRNETNMKKHFHEENFSLIENFAVQYSDVGIKEALSSIICDVKLLTPADTFNPKADMVTLMTLHMAKGLEFRVVFIAGVEESLIPCTIRKGKVDIEEERRLFYVGMTRARDELYLTCARNRFLYGERLAQSPSPFIKEIPEKLREHRFVNERTTGSKRRSQMGLF